MLGNGNALPRALAKCLASTHEWQALDRSMTLTKGSAVTRTVCCEIYRMRDLRRTT